MNRIKIWHLIAVAAASALVAAYAAGTGGFWAWPLDAARFGAAADWASAFANLAVVAVTLWLAEKASRDRRNEDRQKERALRSAFVEIICDAYASLKIVKAAVRANQTDTPEGRAAVDVFLTAMKRVDIFFERQAAADQMMIAGRMRQVMFRADQQLKTPISHWESEDDLGELIDLRWDPIIDDAYRVTQELPENRPASG